MKAIALANRLKRDLNEKSLSNLTADVYQEILDAINGGMQALDAIAPSHSRTTVVSLFLEAASTVSLDVTEGSAVVAGDDFTANQYGRTIRLAGDSIDNQIIGASELLHAYTGATGTVSATIYSDAVALPEPYAELVGDPRILETGRDLTHCKVRNPLWQNKSVCQPRHYWVEPNARNQNPTAPAVIRFDTLPDRAYRLQADATLSPDRVKLSDLLSAAFDIPLRTEHIEIYLLPVARGILTTSELWKNPATKAGAANAGERAKLDYEKLAPRALATPNRRVGTKPGF